MILHTESGNWTRSPQQTGGTFAAKSDSLSRPASSAASWVLDFTRGGAESNPLVPNSLLIHPTGVGADNNTVGLRIWGWAPNKDNTLSDPSKREIWHPTLLLGVDCTLNSGIKGVNGSPIEDEIYYADTIALRAGEGTANVSNEIVSVPDVGAHLVMDLKGFAVIEFEFDMGTATSGGVLLKGY